VRSAWFDVGYGDRHYGSWLKTLQGPKKVAKVEDSNELMKMSPDNLL
jgi:hypothetical protein